MFLIFATSVESILPIVIMILTGYFMARVGWINDKVGNAMTKFILNISLPCYMVWNLMDSFDRNKFFSLFGGITIPFLSMGIAYIAAILLSNLLKVPRNHKGIFRTTFFCSNTIFIGLPVNLALFGQKSVPYVLLYYIVNTTYFWTAGYYEISCDGATAKNPSHFFSKGMLKKILSPALVGFCIGIVLILFKVSLPKFAMDSLKYLGNPTTPLALIFIGLVLSAIRLPEFRFDKEMVVLLIGRFIFSPLLVIVLMHFIHVPALMGKVFLIQSAMPAMTNTSIVAKSCGADYKYASVITVVTTLACIIVIPVLMTVL